jgi:hypothetical protein
MPSFAQKTMQNTKFRWTDVEEEMKNRVKNSAGMFRRANQGFKHNDAQPDDGRNPNPENALGGGSQVNTF